jgi:hypothetical protein
MNPIRKIVLGSVFAGATLVGAGLAGSVLAGTSASAQTASTTAAASSSASSSSSASADQSGTAATPAAPAGQPGQPPQGGSFDPSKGGHVGANGTKEALLTGDVATKVTAATNAAVPGGTIQRVENDAEGAVYEAHMVKADGSLVTVKLGADFKVTSVEDGMK